MLIIQPHKSYFHTFYSNQRCHFLSSLGNHNRCITALAWDLRPHVICSTTRSSLCGEGGGGRGEGGGSLGTGLHQLSNYHYVDKIRTVLHKVDEATSVITMLMSHPLMPPCHQRQHPQTHMPPLLSAVVCSSKPRTPAANVMHS